MRIARSPLCVLGWAVVLLSANAACPEGGAAGTPFVILRSYGSYEDNRRFTERAFAAQERHPGLIEEIWFAGQGDPFSSPEEQGRHAAKGNLTAADRCRTLGMAFSYQQGVTLNHCPDGVVRARIPEDAWAVDRNGKVLYGLFCCTSEFARDHSRKTAEAVMAALQPASYWPDDDLRMNKLAPEPATCFCARCLRLFGERVGRTFDRKGLLAALTGPAAEPQVRREWVAFNAESLGAYARVFREAADAVSPATRVCQQSPVSLANVNGDAYRHILSAYAGKVGTGVRPGGGYYSDQDPFALIGKAVCVARDAARCSRLPFVRQICYEAENWPHVGALKSPGGMMSECAYVLAVGCDSLALFWGADTNGESAGSYDFFFDTLAAWKPFLREMRDGWRGSLPGGVACYVGEGLYATESWTDAFDKWQAAKLARNALPIADQEAYPEAYCLNAAAVATLTREDVPKVFARAVMMDVAAFRRLQAVFPDLAFASKVSIADPPAERALATDVCSAGLERFRSGMTRERIRGLIRPRAPDVVPQSTMTVDPSACGTCRIPTEFGGSVVLFQDMAFDSPSWAGPATVWTGCRRQAILDALDEAVPGGLSARMMTDGYACVVVSRRTADGRTAGAFVFNQGTGETPELELRLRRGISAKWRIVRPRQESIPAIGTVDGEAVLRLPPLSPFGVVAILPEAEPPCMDLAAPIKRWEDALPLGNGQAGALVWGGGDTLRLSLDRADYWHLSTNTVFGNPAFNWTNLIVYAARDVEERKRIFEGRVGDSTKLPGVRLELKFGGGAKIAAFKLDMKRAEALVELNQGGVRKTLRSWFVSDDPLLHLAVPDGVEIASAEFVRNGAFDKLGGYPEPKVVRTKDAIVYTRGNRCTGEWAKAFTTGVRFVPTDAASDVAWWKDFYAHSSVSVPDGRVQRLYDFAMYLYGSGSRDGFAPIALQGLWTADNGELPPWHGDYHHDLNSQMTYWASPVAGHFDSHDAFATYMSRLTPAFKSFAKRFFGLDRGMVVPGAMGYDGSWIAGKSQYAIPPSNGLWAFSVLFDGWNYCPTRERLEAIYPFGVELADAAERLLLPPDAKGVRRWPISTSPEFGEGDTSAWFPPNSNYDRSILIGFFSQMAALAKAKGDAAAEGKYRDLSRSFGPAVLTDDGRYLLAEGRDLTESHRHISHLLDIFPYCAIAPGADARRSLDHFEALGTKEWIGFTPVWAAAMEARLGAGDRALGYLSVFADKFVSRSGLHLNGDQTNSGYSNFTYHPFTLEANFCFARAVQEMLVGAYDDGIRLFPAVPAAWREKGVSFRDLRVPGGHRVSATLAADGSVRGSVTGFADGALTLVLPAGQRFPLAVKKGETLAFPADTARSARIW